MKSCLSCLSMFEILFHIDGQDIQDKKYEILSIHV